MPSQTVRPYRSLPENGLPELEWEITAEEESLGPATAVSGWDYQTRLTVATVVRTTRADVGSHCGLPEQAEPAVILRWNSTGVPLVSGMSEPVALGDDPVGLEPMHLGDGLPQASSIKT